MVGFWGIRQGTALLVNDGDYETEHDETDGDEGKDEGRSVPWVEWTIVVPSVIACRPGAR